MNLMPFDFFCAGILPDQLSLGLQFLTLHLPPSYTFQYIYFYIAQVRLLVSPFVHLLQQGVPIPHIKTAYGLHNLFGLHAPFPWGRSLHFYMRFPQYQSVYHQEILLWEVLQHP